MPGGTASWTFTDVTGNYNNASGTAAIKLTYDWHGFLQPINDTAHQINQTQSKFKLGQTIPVKFMIYNLAGALVQHPGSNPTFKWTPIGPCPASTSTEALSEMPSDSTPVYKWDGAQYHYNWSTKGMTGGLYRIYASIANGAQQESVEICLAK